MHHIYKDDIRKIYRTVGSQKFFWGYVSNKTRFTPERLAGRGFITGKFHHALNQKTWQLSDSTLRECKELYGPVSELVEFKCESALRNQIIFVTVRKRELIKISKNPEATV